MLNSSKSLSFKLITGPRSKFPGKLGIFSIRKKYLATEKKLTWNILPLPLSNSTPLMVTVDWLIHVDLMLGDNILCLLDTVIFGQLSISWETEDNTDFVELSFGCWAPGLILARLSPATEKLLKSSAVFNKIQNQVTNSPECLKAIASYFWMKKLKKFHFIFGTEWQQF